MTPPEPIDAERHVVDLLPHYINGTLDGDEKKRAERHLGRCAACRNSLASWRAIAAATHLVSQRIDKPPVLAEPAARADVAWGYEPKENVMEPIAVGTRHLEENDARPRVILGEAPVRGWAPRALELAVVATILLAILGGFVLYRFGDSGNGRGNGQLAAATQEGSPVMTAGCTATPRTSDSFVAALGVRGLMSGDPVGVQGANAVPNPRDVSADQWGVQGANEVRDPRNVSADQRTQAAVQALWSQYVACAAVDALRAASLLTDNGLRMQFYTQVQIKLNQSVNKFGAFAAVTPSPLAEATGDAGMPPASSPGASSYHFHVDYTAAGVAACRIETPMLLSDGRIGSILDCPAGQSWQADAVFVNVNGKWLIDEITILLG